MYESSKTTIPDRTKRLRSDIGDCPDNGVSGPTR